MKIIVTAGGQGTKIWPFSRKKQPKQFQKIIGQESIFTQNINMLLNKYQPSDIFISTKKMYLGLAKKQAPKIPKKNFIVEPDAPSGRGPGEGFVFLNLSLRYPNEVCTILQSDCLYLPTHKYLETLELMERLVKRDQKLISGGLIPAYPVLGVDYLLLGDQVDSENDIQVYEVKKFLGRKKDYAETAKMVKEERVVIHTNLNTWYPDLMLQAYGKYRPDWFEKLMQIKDILKTGGSEKEIEKIYRQMEKGSTEEVTKHIFEEGYIVVYPFKWFDIGTWDSVYKYLAQKDQVYTEGNVIALDSTGTLVKSVNSQKLIAVLGLKDMVVVDTEDILFIAPRDKVGNIKDVQQELIDKGLEEFL
jgi:mannose-1-phosphate guanylyltransferase